MTGIYKIQSNKKPERIYIGSAVNIKKRWNEHKRDLRLKKHHSIKLQRHCDKYGANDLDYSILLGCEKENLIKNEQFFIDAFKPYFNTSLIANSQLGLKRSSEMKLKISMKNKGKIGNRKGIKATEETREKMRATRRNKFNLKHIGEGIEYITKKEIQDIKRENRLEERAMMDWIKNNKIKSPRKRRRTQEHSSKYRGVSIYKCKKTNKNVIRVAIYYNNKTKTFGDFKTEEEAALFYNERAIELFGNLAILNKI